jgi:hypothetical protein
MRVVVDPIAEMQLDALHQYITQSSGYEEEPMAISRVS